MTKKLFHTAFIDCPHCGERMRSHNHRKINPLAKLISAKCYNPECFFGCEVYIEIHKQTQPSLHPKPEILGQLNKGLEKQG